MVDGLAEYARTAQTPPAPEPVDLGRLAADVVTALGPEIEAAGATVEVGALPSVLGDPGGLSRVLQNLLANAIKYRAQAPPLIGVRAERDDGAWVIAVADNGRGVTERDQRRIFDIFARARADDEVAAAAWASRCARRSSSTTAAASGSSRRRAAEASSASRCPSGSCPTPSG